MKVIQVLYHIVNFFILIGEITEKIIKIPFPPLSRGDFDRYIFVYLPQLQVPPDLQAQLELPQAAF